MSSSSAPPRPTTSDPADPDRPPPPREGQWASPTLKLDIHALPPLPDIRANAVADRARSTAPAPAGKHRNEAESAGSVYSAAVSEELYRDTPASRRAVVQRVRAMLTSQSRPLETCVAELRGSLRATASSTACALSPHRPMSTASSSRARPLRRAARQLLERAS